MKIELIAINAKYIHSNPAVYSLYSCAGEYQKHVEIAEYTINQRTEEIRSDLFLRHPDVLAFSCYIWNISAVMELIEDLSQIMPGIPIWLGGPEVSYRAKKLIRENANITGIMVSEGEKTFRQLVAAYVKDCDFAGILGIVTKDLDTGLPKLMDLSEIPFWYKDEEKGGIKDVFANRIIYYESARGCPFRCSYCLSSIDKTVRFRPLSMVYEELQFFLDQNIPQVKFIDRTFNCNHNHAMAIWTFIKEHDNNVTNFHFEIAADILKEDELAVLCSMRPGLVQLEIGVQTTNAQTLSEIRRTTDMDQLKQNVQILHNAENMHLHLDLIAGLPYEGMESFIHSFNDVYRMEPDELQLGFLKVLSGSYMQEKKEDYGIVYESRPPYEVLSTNWISYKDVLRLKRVEEMLEIYGNSGQFEQSVRFLIPLFDSPFAFFDALGIFYEENGYFTQSPSRAYRYEILLSFAIKIKPEYEKIYQELLLFDLYFRENLKSRPDFAPDFRGQEAMIWSFYQNEERTREYLPAYEEYTAKQRMHMTHLELFKYPVWDVKRLWSQLKEGLASPCNPLQEGFGSPGNDAVLKEYCGGVLFDYGNRDFLYGNAGWSVISMQTFKED